MSLPTPPDTAAAQSRGRQDPSAPASAWEILRALILWFLAAAFFFPVCIVLILLGIFIDPRKTDGMQRWFCRTVMRLAGARIEVRRSPGFDAQRTCLFISNHVNLFDPFVLYSAVPQFLRGWELESHFRIPVYGWLMKRFGNVPVPDENRPSDLKRMWKRTKDALDARVSLVVFPEGGRTITGRVGEFKEGGFRLAVHFGAPIVPVSLVGSFDHNRKTSWMLRPARIVVHLHDVIETRGITKDDVAALGKRVREIIGAPVDDLLSEKESFR